MTGECPKDTTLASTLLNPWQKVLGFLNVRVRVEKPLQMMLKVSICQKITTAFSRRADMHVGHVQSAPISVEMLNCERCIEISEQMMLMVIIVYQKIAKTFCRLATMYVGHSQGYLIGQLLCRSIFGKM